MEGGIGKYSSRISYWKRSYCTYRGPMQRRGGLISNENWTKGFLSFFPQSSWHSWPCTWGLREQLFTFPSRGKREIRKTEHIWIVWRGKKSCMAHLFFVSYVLYCSPYQTRVIYSSRCQSECGLFLADEGQTQHGGRER